MTHVLECIPKWVSSVSLRAMGQSRHGTLLDFNSTEAKMVSKNSESESDATYSIAVPYLSRLRYGICYPGSKSELVHSTGNRQGVSVVVPLIPNKSGEVLQILAASHHSWGEGFNGVLKALSSSCTFLAKNRSVWCTLHAEPGDVVIVDNRVQRRFLSNSDKIDPRAYLELTYDFSDTPSPGITVGGGFIHHLFAIALIGLGKLDGSLRGMFGLFGLKS